MIGADRPFLCIRSSRAIGNVNGPGNLCHPVTFAKRMQKALFTGDRFDIVIEIGGCMIMDRENSSE